MTRRSRNGMVAAIGSALVAAMAACGGGAPPGVVARLDGVELTAEDLAGWEATAPEARARRRPNESAEAHRERLLEQFIVDRLLTNRLQGWQDELPEEVRRGVEDDRETLLRGEVEKLVAAPRIAVTPDEARQHYDANPDLFGHEGRIRLRHVFRRLDRDASPEARAAARREMQGIREEILAGGNFEDLARERSDSETAAHGGLIGVVDRGVFGEPLDSIVWGLGEGQLSEVIATPVGFHVFRLDKHLPGERTPYEEAESRILRRLTREKTNRVHAELLAELLEASGAELRPEALASGDEAAVLFALEEEALTLGTWRSTLASRPFFEAREEPEEKLLANWALGRLYLWEARRRGLDDSEELAAALEPLRRERLATRLRDEARRLAAESLGDGPLRAYFEEEEVRFQSPLQVDLSLLVRRFPEREEGWYAIFEELRDLAAEIRAGVVDFAEEARRLSDDPSASLDGRVGPVRLDSFQEWAGPTAQNRVLELAAGEVSDPILVERYVQHQLVYDRYGYMLVQVHEVLEPRTPTFEEARDRVVDRLVRGAPPEIEARIRAAILETAGAELFPENL